MLTGAILSVQTNPILDGGLMERPTSFFGDDDPGDDYEKFGSRKNSELFYFETQYVEIQNIVNWFIRKLAYFFRCKTGSKLDHIVDADTKVCVVRMLAIQNAD